MTDIDFVFIEYEIDVSHMISARINHHSTVEFVIGIGKAYNNIILQWRYQS